MERIPDDEYAEQIASRVILPCVDVILYRQNKDRREVLLLVRAEDPAQNCLYPIGGAISKTEFSTDAVLRKVQEETGIGARVERMVGIYETIYAKAQNPKTKRGLHTINQGFLASVDGDSRVTLDHTSLSFDWISEADVSSLADYSRVLIEDSGVFTGAINPIQHRLMDYRDYNFEPFHR